MNIILVDVFSADALMGSANIGDADCRGAFRQMSIWDYVSKNLQNEVMQP